MKFSPNAPCPCHSGVKYKRCCRPFHRGASPGAPSDLMRARYSAFALGLAQFVMDTTHPEGSSYERDRAHWERSVLAFAEATSFDNLEIVEASGGAEVGHVTFHASLRSDGKDVSFTERSRFVRVESRWLYHTGVVQPTS